MEVLSTLDRDCSALAGLFQIIVNDLKNSGPMWEDFLTKTSKLQHALKSTLVVFSSFLDAFQRIADSATHTRGATKDVGAALTRLSLRHRAIESRIKNLTDTLTTCLLVPLQEKLDEWRRTHHALDKEHTKEYKRVRADIKKRTENATRLQKKAKKAGKNSELNKVVENTVGDLLARYGVLEETERTALRHALKEERARYCTFAVALKPVLEEEVGLVTELAHIQEVMEQLEKQSSDPHTLPPASEQVLDDVKSGDSKWSWQTPPSSPTSSLGSRKSSLCSISSLNSSSSSSTHSPSHHARTRSASGLSEASCSDGSHTPSPAAPATATWPNLTDSTLQHKSASATGLHTLTDRPHTISSAYERGKDRPPLTVYTFQPPDGRSGPASPQISSQPVSPVCYEIEGGSISPLVGHTATISRRSSRTSLHHNLSSSSQESLNAGNKPKPPVPLRCSSLERPSVPDKKASVRQAQQQQQLLHHLQLKQQEEMEKNASAESSGSALAVPDFNKAAPDMVLPQPLYSNMSELRGDLVGFHAQLLAEERLESDGCSSHVSLGSSGYGSQPNMTLDHTSRLEGFVSSRTGSLRRGQKPPPPVRRTSSISSTSSLATSAFPSNASTGSVSSSSLNSTTSTLLASPVSARSVKAANVNGGSSSTSNESSTNVSPLQKTDSESSTPVGSMESLPPPPAFLLEENSTVGEGGALDSDSTTPEGVLCAPESLRSAALLRDECLQQRKISVSETVRSLQESRHQPPSPVTHRRSQSLRMTTPPPQLKAAQCQEERRSSLEGPRAALMSSLNAKLALSNPVLGSLPRQKSPIQQVIPIYSMPPSVMQKGNLSPKMSRSRLSSVQEVVALEESHRPSPSMQTKEISSFKGKPLTMPQQQQPKVATNAIHAAGNVAPKNASLATRGEGGSKRHSGVTKDPFIQNLNMVLAQRVATGAESPGVSSTSPKAKHKKRVHVHPNGAPPATPLQRSGSSASEKASKVRQWISSKKGLSTEVSASSLRESLLDQIRKGTTLRRAKHVADRSAPRVH